MLGVWRRKTVRQPMCSHLHSLVGADAHIAARPGTAEQHKARLFVFHGFCL